MKNILIPTDFSENSWNAIAYSLSFFKDSKCVFYIVHTTQKYEGTADAALLTENYALSKVKSDFKNLTKKIEQHPHRQEHQFFTLHDTGNLVETIRKQVHEKQIDLIVMGTKGASGIRNTEISSNTMDVISKVKCNVLVVPENATFKPVQQITLPTDYNFFYFTNILETLSCIIEKFSASLHVIHLSKDNENLTEEQLINKETLQDYFFYDSHKFHTLTHKNLEAALQKFIKKNNIELLVMVAKNIHFFQQLFYKSSLKDTTYHSNTPFFILHE